MDHQAFLVWLNEIDDLSSKQRAETGRLVAGVSSLESVIDLPEATVREGRICPHCASGGAIIRGHASGLTRFFCKGCRKTFNVLTFSIVTTVLASAERCMVADTTAFRWRHRFPEAVTVGAVKLCGIVEADGTFFPRSRKGDRNLSRKARKRGGKASKRGLSKEQVPVPVAVDRSGTTISAVLPAVTAEHLKTVLQPRLDGDALPVTDGCTGYPPCAAETGVSHESLDRTAGERVRGELHIQTVNSRHERLKTFPRRHRGIATKYLDSYLRWFHLAVLPSHQTPRAILAAAAAAGILPVTRHA